MTEEKVETTRSRPFQLRPSILSSGFGISSNKTAASSTEKKGFVLRPSSLSSATDQLEALHKLDKEPRKRSLDEIDSTPPSDVDEVKKSKLAEEIPNNTNTINIAEDIKQPAGIGTFGFASGNSSVDVNSSSSESTSSAKPNYFQQGLNSTNKSEKITFGFDASAKSTFSSINKNNGDNVNDNNTPNEIATNDDETKVKLLESAEEYQKSQNQRQQFKEVEQFTGEEGEQHVLQIVCKLHLFNKEDRHWLEKGRGTLKLNDICQYKGVFQSRLVFRTQGTNIVLLNTKLWAEMCCEKVKDKSIRITALDPETKEMKVYLITANLKDTLQIYTAIDRRVEALKRNRDKSSNHDDDDDDDHCRGESNGRGRRASTSPSRRFSEDYNSESSQS